MSLSRLLLVLAMFLVLADPTPGFWGSIAGDRGETSQRARAPKDFSPPVVSMPSAPSDDGGAVAPAAALATEAAAVPVPATCGLSAAAPPAARAHVPVVLPVPLRC